MILVTGGAGFIGANYLHKLHQENPNRQVVCVDKLTYASNYDYIYPLVESGFVIFESADITVEYKVNTIFQRYQPSHVVHFAAESHVDNSIQNLNPFVQTNINGTINLLQQSLLIPKFEKFLHVSTDEVYGSLGLDEDRSFTETSHYQSNSPYSASKAASDCFVRAFYKTYGLPTVITNCSNNYGPNQHQEKFIPTVIHKALNDSPIPIYGLGLNIRDWLYVDDHCKAINMVLEHGIPGEKYNIGGGSELSNIDLAKKILDMLGKSHDLISFVDDRAGHDLRYSIDYSKIKTQLGYTPNYDLETGLIKTLKWYKK